MDVQNNKIEHTTYLCRQSEKNKNNEMKNKIKDNIHVKNI